MKALLPLLFISLSTIPCSHASDTPDVNGFDTACDIFKQASQKNLSPEELGQYIGDRLKSMPEQKAKQDAIDTYDVLFQATPALRYQLFKESAEYSLKRKWHCEAIKKIYDMK